MKLKKLKCNQCDYEWIPRTEDVRVCPKCRSLRWDKEPIEKINREEQPELLKEIKRE